MNNFGTLALQAYKEKSIKDFHLRLAQVGLSARAFSEQKMLNRPHRPSFAFRVCLALDLDAKEAFKALCLDAGVQSADLNELIKSRPDLFLYKFAFNDLRLRQPGLDLQKQKCVIAENANILKALKTCGFSANYRLDYLKRHYFLMQSVDEIAKETGVNSRSILRTLARGLQRLHERADLIKV